MPMQTLAKRERIIEAVRHGFEGDAAVEFIHQNGYAMSTAGIARHLRAMGGRGKIQDLINDGKTNRQVLEICFPEADLSEVPWVEPSQGELFHAESEPVGPVTDEDERRPLYETAKISARVPADVYEAIRLAAKAEHKSQNQLIVEILTTALSNMPAVLEAGGHDAAGTV